MGFKTTKRQKYQSTTFAPIVFAINRIKMCYLVVTITKFLFTLAFIYQCIKCTLSYLSVVITVQLWSIKLNVSKQLFLQRKFLLNSKEMFISNAIDKIPYNK